MTKFRKLGLISFLVLTLFVSCNNKANNGNENSSIIEKKEETETKYNKKSKYVLATDEDFEGDGEGRHFQYIGTNEYVEVPHVIKGVSITDVSYMFMRTSVKGVKSSNKNITNMGGMFTDLKSTELDLSQLNTSSVTNMDDMFWNAEIETIDFNNFDTSNVTSMKSMFTNSNIINIEFSDFNTKNVVNMHSMFENAEIKEIDLSSFDTSKVESMGRMFDNIRTEKLDISSFNTTNVKNMYSMFGGYSLEFLDLSHFNTENVRDMGSMFIGTNLYTLDLRSFDFSGVKGNDDGVKNMFQMSSLNEIYVKDQADADFLRDFADEYYSSTEFLTK